MSATDQAKDFREAMSRLASGVSLITARSVTGVSHGMLATAVTSVSATPPILLACINRSATMLTDLQESGAFCVNFLGADHRGLADRFLSNEGRASRFNTDSWGTLVTGTPVLESSLASLDCRLAQSIDTGTHAVIFGSVVSVSVQKPEMDGPMIYFQRKYGGWIADPGKS
ncbi:MAG TPA: flavin reductase family protein [Paracoccus sp. (in: a-proteobacteria)]|uniref:flavin reductase family protein n=1 Tax=Paracoccus sp. TaxID=267 RepID=UPI002D1689C8|nr:flavin reductase family protein [Paracoccus sp. (in: a-proteobacteria)]HWL57440.1 flavin reductase family protein [Paracoccus sp. (in: a-proteobacteria)]